MQLIGGLHRQRPVFIQHGIAERAHAARYREEALTNLVGFVVQP